MVWKIIDDAIKHNSSQGIIIVGPTASGKSALALELAIKYKAHIVSCDSVQIYKDFNIGTAKPTLQEQSLVPHHLIDIVFWYEEFDAALYSKLAKQTILNLLSNNIMPIIVGGSGLYLRALMQDQFSLNLPKDKKLRQALNEKSSEQLYQELLIKDPQRAKEIHPNDKFRIIRALELVTLTNTTIHNAYQNNLSVDSVVNLENFLVIYLNPSKQILQERINQRTLKMLKDGLIEEVEDLLNKGCTKDAKPMQSIGYKQVIQMLDNQMSTKDLHQSICVATWQYAKRQKTWFNKLKANIVITD